mmetsp:Transcript_22362/g.33040  ORF Transcript_22362/g.33040 Transcript_22362/m.33040 type:complete len:133 (-) Transcript_22362:461-859(-)|eukprot:CAMPEP_0194225746 /NCGR_PEP_ID=MMETSP0156-20130528/40263_1 /TAXON_ID=33649 /ORGANISM="Thalassionema nitzschioides, Strain L26-B" /LENGTH=132 /DNA_ID=CAMNT_0038957823 /DNA_START=305 /DNA_END=703 /DNA_ORIENTATION=-
MKGVNRVVVGYTGGKEQNPTYQCMLDATEALLVEFDPEIVSYEDILVSWSEQHNPQYPQSTQYRSALWVKNNEQREAAMKQNEAMKRKQHGFGTKNKTRKIYVDIEDVGPFYKAEEYHQDYLRKKMGGNGVY